MDFSENQKKPNINISKKQVLNSFKDNLALGLFTLVKTLKPSFRMSLLPPIESLNTLAKKKPYYKIVPTKKAKLKKKINNNIGKQNIVIKKIIKK